MLRKVAVLALLLAVVLASFPTKSVLADNPVANKLEKKWDQLVDRYKIQAQTHEQAHKMVDNWLKTHKNASTKDKNELQKHLDICNSALASAKVLIAKHPGFDSGGNVIDVALATTTVKDLANYLQVHTGSVKNLKEHTK